MDKNREFKLLKAEGLERVYSITVPKGTIEGEVIKRLKEIQEKLELPGFPVGKVPMDIIRIIFQKTIVSQVVDEVVNEDTNKLFKAEGIRPASSPKVDVITFETDQELVYKVEVEILPDVPLSDLDYNNITLEKPVANIQEQDVTDRLVKIANENNGQADENLAVKLGFSDLKEFREVLKKKIEKDCQIVARNLLKKQLFDKIESIFTFDLPQEMLMLEVKTLKEKLKEYSPETSEDELLKLAERRVRLGIVLSAIAWLENITVTDEEINEAIQKEIRNFPGQEQKILEFYQDNPQRFEAFRGFILEEKVCDFIFEKVSITERVVSISELKQMNQF